MILRLILTISLLIGLNLFSSAQGGFFDTTFVDSGSVIHRHLTMQGANNRNISVSNSGQIIISVLTGVNNAGFPSPLPRKIWMTSLLSNGKTDTTFGQNGWKSILCGGCHEMGGDLFHLQNGSFVLLNSVLTSFTPYKSDIYGWRINNTGVVDTTFNTSALEIDEIKNVLLQNNGLIVPVVSSRKQLGIFRIDKNGRIDSTFGINGLAKTDSVTHLGTNFNNFKKAGISKSGEIYVGGIENLDSTIYYPIGVIYKFTSNGNRSQTFGTNGKKIFNRDVLSIIELIGVLPDNRIIIKGFGTDNQNISKLMCLNPNGTIDFSFGNSGRVSLLPEYNHTELIITPDGKILLFGENQQHGSFIDCF